MQRDCAQSNTPSNICYNTYIHHVLQFIFHVFSETEMFIFLTSDVHGSNRDITIFLKSLFETSMQHLFIHLTSAFSKLHLTLEREREACVCVHAYVCVVGMKAGEEN